MCWLDEVSIIVLIFVSFIFINDKNIKTNALQLENTRNKAMVE